MITIETIRKQDRFKRERRKQAKDVLSERDNKELVEAFRLNDLHSVNRLGRELLQAENGSWRKNPIWKARLENIIGAARVVRDRALEMSVRRYLQLCK